MDDFIAMRLLAPSSITILGAVAGSHGWSKF
jgi:hypothetical protein